jgi:hypothetical protein
MRYAGYGWLQCALRKRNLLLLMEEMDDRTDPLLDFRLQILEGFDRSDYFGWVHGYFLAFAAFAAFFAALA